MTTSGMAMRTARLMAPSVAGRVAGQGGDRSALILGGALSRLAAELSWPSRGSPLVAGPWCVGLGKESRIASYNRRNLHSVARRPTKRPTKRWPQGGREHVRTGPWTRAGRVNRLIATAASFVAFRDGVAGRLSGDVTARCATGLDGPRR